MVTLRVERAKRWPRVIDANEDRFRFSLIRSVSQDLLEVTLWIFNQS